MQTKDSPNPSHFPPVVRLAEESQYTCKPSSVPSRECSKNSSQEVGPSSSERKPCCGSSHSNWEDPRWEEWRASLTSNISEIMSKLKRIESLIGEDPIDYIGNVLPKKLSTPEEVAAFDKKLEDKELMRHLVKGLAELHDSNDVGYTVRKCMDSLMTRQLMEKYSVMGQRGKLPLVETKICAIIYHVVHRCGKELSFSLVKDTIARYIKRVPHEKGGDKYKSPKTPRIEKKDLGLFVELLAEAEN